MQGEDHEAVEWPNVEMVRCRDVGDLLHGHRCGYAGTNELACPNHIPCPGQMYVPLSRCPSPERDTDGLTREERLIEEIKRFAWCTQCPACKARAEAVLDEFTAPKADER